MHMDVLLTEQVIQWLDALIEDTICDRKGYRLVDFQVIGNVSCDRIVFFLLLLNFQWSEISLVIGNAFCVQNASLLQDCPVLGKISCGWIESWPEDLSLKLGRCPVIRMHLYWKIAQWLGQILWKKRMLTRRAPSWEGVLCWRIEQ